jgi:hypothetical protein
MSDLFIGGPISKLVFTNELEQDISVNIVSQYFDGEGERFFHGEDEHNLVLKSKRVTEFKLILISFSSSDQFVVSSRHTTLHICPQARGRVSPTVQSINHHDCPFIEENDKISIRFEHIKCKEVLDVAFIVVTEDENHGFWWRSPSTLYNITLWNCVLRGIDSNTIKEYTNQHYETERIQCDRNIGWID